MFFFVLKAIELLPIVFETSNPRSKININSVRLINYFTSFTVFFEGQMEVPSGSEDKVDDSDDEIIYDTDY